MRLWKNPNEVYDHSKPKNEYPTESREFLCLLIKLITNNFFYENLEIVRGCILIHVVILKPSIEKFKIEK